MRNFSSKLYEKSLDLKNARIFGGQTTYIDCSSATSERGCTDTRYTTTDDKGTQLAQCTEFTCP